MQKASYEPGLLQVFRLYGWLYLLSLLIFPLPLLFRRSILGSTADLWISAVVMVVFDICLLGLLYSTWLQERLNRFYIPLALGIATVSLLIGQRLFAARGILFQGNPFIYILIILVAWQYNFPTVLVYTLGIGLFEAALIFFLPFSLFSPLLFPDETPLFTYGISFSRIITFLILGYVVTRLASAQRKQRQALAEANQKLVSHAATLEQLATSRERVRLSRELHDTLAHTLSALAVQLEAVMTVWDGVPPKAQSILEQMLATTRSGLDETRRALSALRASPLEDMGLAVAVRSLAEDLAARNRLALDLHIPDNLDDISPEVEQCFYRIAQEALENVTRHANATELSVRLEQTPDKLSLTIIDDGEGFTPHENSNNNHKWGIKGMKERAELIGADLTIDSQPGRGTTVHLALERELWSVS